MEFRTAGIVLKKQNFGEADRILRIFSAEFGVISALAKGVKKTKSRKSGALELFGETNFRLHRRSGELFLITDAAAISSFESVNLEILRAAFAAGELILNLAPPEKPLPKIYEIFREFLRTLPTTEKISLAQIAFFTKVLSILGFFAIGEKVEIRTKKFFKFLLEKDFAEILRLENDPKIFRAAEKNLLAIFENAAEKNSRVAASTRNWVKFTK